jgi:hypothetical protein
LVCAPWASAAHSAAPHDAGITMRTNVSVTGRGTAVARSASAHSAHSATETPRRKSSSRGSSASASRGPSTSGSRAQVTRSGHGRQSSFAIGQGD